MTERFDLSQPEKIVKRLYTKLDEFYDKKCKGFTEDTQEAMKNHAESLAHDPFGLYFLMSPSSHINTYSSYGPYFHAEDNAWAVLALLSDNSKERKNRAKEVANFMKKKLRIYYRPIGGKADLFKEFAKDNVLLGITAPFCGRYIKRPRAPNDCIYTDENAISGIAMLNTGHLWTAKRIQAYIKNVLFDKETGGFYSSNWDFDPEEIDASFDAALFLNAMKDKSTEKIIENASGTKNIAYDGLLTQLAFTNANAENILRIYGSWRGEMYEVFRPSNDAKMALIGNGKQKEKFLNYALKNIFENKADYPIRTISQAILALRPEKAKKLLYLKKL